MKYKRLWAVAILTVLLLSLSLHTAAAQTQGADTQSAEERTEDLYAEQLEASGALDLYTKLPGTSDRLMRELGVSLENPASFLSISLPQILRIGLAALYDAFARPFRTGVLIVGILLLCTLIKSLKEEGMGEELGRVLDVVAVLCIVVILVPVMMQSLSYVKTTISDFSVFLSAFVPTLVSVLVAAGLPVTASGTSALILVATQLISNLTASFVLPLSSAFLAVSVAGSVYPDVRAEKLAGFLKSVAVWTLTLLVTVFMGLMTVQGSIASSADTVTMKAAKVMLSAVPAVGSALSDALGSVQGCMALLKNTVGAFGIIAGVMIFLPPLLQAVAWKAVFTLSGAVCEFLDTGGVSGVLKAFSAALSIIIGVILSFVFMLICALTVLMRMTTAAG